VIFGPILVHKTFPDNTTHRADSLTHFPAVFGDEEVEEWRQNECSHAGAAHCYASRQRSPFVKVEADHDDGRQVHESKANTCHRQTSSSSSLLAVQIV